MIHTVRSYYAGIADRWVLDCTCGWHDVVCDGPDGEREMQSRMMAHLANPDGEPQEWTGRMNRASKDALENWAGYQINWDTWK